MAGTVGTEGMAGTVGHEANTEALHSPEDTELHSKPDFTQETCSVNGDTCVGRLRHHHPLHLWVRLGPESVPASLPLLPHTKPTQAPTQAASSAAWVRAGWPAKRLRSNSTCSPAHASLPKPEAGSVTLETKQPIKMISKALWLFLPH